MNEIILKINEFKEKVANLINTTELPADVMKYILQDYVGALTSLATQQLYMAQKEKEDIQHAKN